MSPHTLQDIKSIIKARSDLFEQNFAAADAAKLVAEYYVPDEFEPVVSAPDAPAVKGRMAIAALFGAFFQGFSRARQVPHFIRAGEDLAWEMSNSYLTPKGGGAELEFRYTAVWRRCADTWRVEADFFATGPVV